MKFVFLATTVISIFAGGSVLMSLISTGAKAVNEDVSKVAGDYSTTFLQATFLFALLVAIIGILAYKAENEY